MEYEINPLGRRLTADEVGEMAQGFDALIAGTEQIPDSALAKAKRLKLIARVGIGLDGIDLLSAQRRGIAVSYTPDAPAPAVSELTVGLILSLLRGVHLVNLQMHAGRWNRYFGRRISEVTFGVIGCGRVGTRVLQLLSGLGARHVLVSDVRRDQMTTATDLGYQWATIDEIRAASDVITMHVPLTRDTRDLFRATDLMRLKPDALLVNTSRGGIINEHDLAAVLRSGHLGGAAIDVFEHEPYAGNLASIDRCLLTSHMGSMSIDCRNRMELEATQEVARFLTGNPLLSPVPDDEYEMRRIVEPQ